MFLKKTESQLFPHSFLRLQSIVLESVQNTSISWHKNYAMRKISLKVKEYNPYLIKAYLIHFMLLLGCSANFNFYHGGTNKNQN